MSEVRPIFGEIEPVEWLQSNSKDFIFWRSSKLFTEAKDNIDKQSSALEEICSLLAAMPASKQLGYVEQLGKVYKPKKRWEAVLESAIKARKKEEKENDREPESEQIPQVTMVEKFIEEKFDIRYNDISNQFEFKKKEDGEYGVLNENTIYRQLQKAHIRYSMADILALLKSDFTLHINPVRDYFNALPEWDQQYDHINKLADYIHLHNPGDDDRFRRMFKKMFVRSIACSFEVDFNKQAFIFVHEKQNSGKTTFCRWLCPPQLQDYYTENINTDKDSLIALTENFIINLDELSTLSKFEINALKSVMTKSRIKVRIPYDRRPCILQRRCNFVGSTNRIEFLTDETGNSRWVCFLIDEIDWDYSKDMDINKVWAQAYYLFKKGDFNYQLTNIEIIENDKANIDFLVRTPELELVQKYYSPGTSSVGCEFMTATEITNKLTRLTLGSVKLSVNNVGKALIMLGYVKESRRLERFDFPVKGYWVEHLYEDTTEPVEEEEKLPY